MAEVGVARVVLQQCLSARLQTQPVEERDTPAQFVEAGRGLVIYICFLKGATIEILDKIVKSTLNAKLSEVEDKKGRCSVVEAAGDVLIVPQATLGGKFKGKVAQYHNNVNKDLGADLYAKFIELCRDALIQGESSGRVQHGTYGNRQVLNVETNGPFTHLMEF